MPQRVAGSCQQLDLDSGSDPLQLTACSVSIQPALVVLKHLRHAYGTSACMLTHFAVTLPDTHAAPGNLPSFAGHHSMEATTPWRAQIRELVMGFITLRTHALPRMQNKNQLVLTVTGHVLYSPNKQLNVNGSDMECLNAVRTRL